MADIALVGAVLLGALGVMLGSRSSIVLLFNLGLSTILQACGVSFDLVWWIAIDMVMMLCIWRRTMPHRDTVILALYPVIWCLYLAPQPWQFWLVYGAVICQLILSVPWVKVWHRARITPAPDHRTPFDLRVTCDV